MRFFNKYIFLLICFIFSHICSYSQQNAVVVDKSVAEDFFNSLNYRNAVNEYLKLLKTDSSNVDYNYKLGCCYLLTSIDKKKAIPYFEYLINNSSANVDVWYNIGLAYHYAYRFDDAINAFNEYKKRLGGKKDVFAVSADRRIEICNSAKEMIKKPVNVSFENLGPEVNSSFPDYTPFIPEDESYIVYTSRRDRNVGGTVDVDGYNTSDVYVSFVKNHYWTKAKGVPSINTSLVEECVGLSGDGECLFYFAGAFLNMGEVYVSKCKGKSFQVPEALGTSLPQASAASVTPDKQYLFFSSAYGPDALGGKDIYMTRKMPDGSWGPPVNLGKTINTPYDEDFPDISDGKTLYFSSQGYNNSMGDFDVYRSDWNRKESLFSAPQNLGYPINTPENNYTISFSSSGRYAYSSYVRDGGFGDIDIYKIIFNDVKPPYTVVQGRILNTDSANIFLPVVSKKDTVSKKDSVINQENLLDLDIKITVTDKKTEKFVGVYSPNKQTGKYIMILSPGEYKLNVGAEGFQPCEEKLLIYDLNTKDELIKDIILRKN